MRARTCLWLLATCAGLAACTSSPSGPVRKATRAWTSCMTRNGYNFGQPDNVFFTELRQMYGTQRSITPGEPVSPAASHAQLAVAATDAACTQAADLAGIFFATEASYEQQLVTANQQPWPPRSASTGTAERGNRRTGI